MQLALDVVARGEWTILSVRGELDLATGPQLRQKVAALVAEGHQRLGLDLTALDFIDSIGLGMVVAALKRVQSVGGSLFVVADEERIRRPFELTGLTEVLELVSSVDDGVGQQP